MDLDLDCDKIFHNILCQECPTCKGEMIEGRNIAMERIAGNVFNSSQHAASAPREIDQTSEESSTLVGEEEE